MTRRTVWIDGVALWAPGLPGWSIAEAALRGGEVAPITASAASAAPAAARRPAPDLLPPNERRRAPDAVLLALQVAQEAVSASGHAAADLASVFTSAYGDLAIVDALCRTLAEAPQLLSPTRFHHSVHNAASGYWAMAVGSQAATTALAAFDRSFAAGLLEALALCAADDRPVLLVGADTEAVGPLASVNRSRGLLGVALVLAPRRGPASRRALHWALAAGPAAPPALRSAAAQALARNAQADALPLFEALADASAARLALPLAGDGVHLDLRLDAGLGHHPGLPLPNPTA